MVSRTILRLQGPSWSSNHHLIPTTKICSLDSLGDSQLHIEGLSRRLKA